MSSAEENGKITDAVLESVYQAKTIPEIKKTLRPLQQYEASVTAKLDHLVASQAELLRDLGKLDILRANLGSQVINARAVRNGMLSSASTTARRISGAVKRLDLEQSRVKATLDVVEQVAELKTCVLGVHGSMGAPQDWEMAAGYLSRASKIPAEVIDSSFAGEMVPTAEVPDPPRVTLNDAAESLCGLFLREFNKAAREGNVATVTRYFKLFPLIGRADVGLDAYGQFVCQGVAAQARVNLNAGTGGAKSKDGLVCVNALTKLFEQVALIVERHSSLVEQHYGPGRMIKVIERLQSEVDLQGGIILDTWSDIRALDRRLTDIKSYAFSFLVQSFLPGNKPSAGTPRTGSPAGRDGAGSREEGDIDMKEIDGLLSHAAVMLGRWALYSRYMATKTAPQKDEAGGSPIGHPLQFPTFLAKSALQNKIARTLVDPFGSMSTFFFRRSIERAFQIDEQPPSLSLNPHKPLGANPPFVTSAVDDVMYMVNQVLQRALATSQRAVVTGVFPTVARILGSDLVGMIQRRMRDECYPRPVIQGGLPPEDKIISFIVLMNDLDVANDYIKRINSNLSRSGAAPAEENDAPQAAALDDLFPFADDATAVANAIKSLGTTFEAKTLELLDEAVSVTFTEVIRPRMRPILADAFRDVQYDTSSTAGPTDGAEPAADDDSSDHIVRARFERGWDALMRPLARILTPANVDRLLSLTIEYLSRVLEKRIWGLYGRVDELGAVRLERDIAGIVAVAVKGGRYTLRDAFDKCTQMVLVMNMEDDEWEDLSRERTARGEREEEEEDLGIVWVLDEGERRRARAIVKDRS